MVCHVISLRISEGLIQIAISRYLENMVFWHLYGISLKVEEINIFSGIMAINILSDLGRTGPNGDKITRKGPYG